MLTRTGASRLVAVFAVVLAGAVSGCASHTDDKGADQDGKSASSTARPAPTRALVVWVDSMCEATSSLERVKTDSAETIEEITRPTDAPAFRQDPGFAAESYLSSTSSSLDTIAREFTGLRPSGITGADTLRASLLKGVDGIRPEITKLSDFMTLTGLSSDEKVSRAERVAELVGSLKQPKPDLPALVADEPKLSDAYRLAPRCVPPARPSSPPASPSKAPAPTGSLPPAADGKDVGACEDGKCQVLVTEPRVDIEVGDLKLDVSVKDTGVTVHHSYPSGGSGTVELSGEGAEGGFGRAGGRTVTVTLTGLNKDGAVLDIATGA